jgi:Protein phosphatase 2C
VPGQLTRWRVIGGSVAGTLHVDRGLGCDDAHGWRVLDGAVLLAVADGAGSRTGTSAIGAHVAVTAVLDHLERHPDATMPDVFSAARAALDDEATALGLGVDRLATTLAVAVLTPERTVVGQVGDGVLVVDGADNDGAGAIAAIAIADRFEYANEVVFLTADQALDHLKVFAGGPSRGIALSTDGLRYKILDDLHDGLPFVPFFEESWRYARGANASSEAIVRFLDDIEDQTGDDKTLVLAVRDPEGDGGVTRAITDRPAPSVPPDAQDPNPEPAPTAAPPSR